ncbi:phage virion morphogenesis protein [Cerasicoccus maritimus]|uniref:phage virion morphogenesis protein n=1 Tax=Cerasicoccus maritimus TaxID=490089 RepID=UPI002852839A|nr:phage virion morphogenesis protein [Cerasicoccus maritimus]
MSLRIIQDTLSPGLRRKAKAIEDPTPILRVMGVTLQSYTVQTFSELVPRARRWPNKKDGTPSNLQRTTALRQSIRLVSVDRRKAVVGTDRLYAAVHQFGSQKQSGYGSGIPARPYFPFRGERMIPEAHRRVKAAAQAQLAVLLR